MNTDNRPADRILDTVIDTLLDSHGGPPATILSTDMRRCCAAMGLAVSRAGEDDAIARKVYHAIATVLSE